MAYQSIWYYTDIPNKIIDIIEEDLFESFNDNLQDSQVGDIHKTSLDKSTRNSKNAWIPTNHWLGGFVWSYIERANRENFLYDLKGIDGESLQYTTYDEGQYYKWHQDQSLPTFYKPNNSPTMNRMNTPELINDFLSINTEYVRKLSFSLLLSDPDTYEGGNFQIMNDTGKSYIAPRKRGVIVIFDSRATHRVQKVTKGVRKSVVGWAVGPRWK